MLKALFDYQAVESFAADGHAALRLRPFDQRQAVVPLEALGLGVKPHSVIDDLADRAPGAGKSVDVAGGFEHGIGAFPYLDERDPDAFLRQAPGIDLCFGLAAERPFRPDRLQVRADEAWKAAGLERLTLHDCRHTYASFAIAARVNIKALSTYMVHSSVKITLDRYGHLMPGNEAEAADLLDAYLTAAAAL